MRVLLALLTFFLTLSSVFDWDPGPAPGVKIKNFILYLLALGLAFKFATGRGFKVQLPAMNWAFMAYIAYAILTYVVIVLFIDYPRYNVLTSAFDLKNRAVDYMLFFLVFFYGTRSKDDAIFVLKCLLASWILSHAVAVLDATGLMQLGDIERRIDGRVQGAVGESNQYGAFVAMTLPAALAMAAMSRGMGRWFWIAASVLTGVTLIMTVSRGAFVAMLFATLVGAWIFRRHLSLPRLMLWAGAAGIALVVLLTLVVSAGFGDLLYERVVASASARDLSGTSSGRTDIWTNALAMMIEHPYSLITGFGWNAYWSMPFRYSPHNHYLAQWFNLGLIGLVTSVMLLAIPVREALRSFAMADPQVRGLLAGFVIATLAFATATFFVDLYSPWLYFWAYAGVMMRLAMLVREQPVAQVSPVVASPSRADPYGWVAVRQ